MLTQKKEKFHVYDNNNNVFIYGELLIKYMPLLISHMVLLNIKQLRKRAAKTKAVCHAL